MSDTTSIRRQKLELLRENGQNPYPDRFEKTHELAAVKTMADGDKASLAGRVLSVRKFGKLIFATLGNAKDRAQISLSKADLGDEAFALFNQSVDIGDHIGVSGVRYVTKRGEPTLKSFSWQMLSKTLRPMPEKFHGVADEEIGLKQRYLVTASDPDAAQIYLKRAQMKRFLRQFLEQNGFIEIDTPAIQIQKSGALARAFVTHHNALDIEAALRIAPETYLKRALIGGYDRVYEIAVCFRNEGVSAAHWPEFHMLEFYAAYWNYEDLISFTQTLFKALVEELTGGMKISYQGTEIDFSGDWPRLSFREFIIEHAGLDIDAFPTVEALRAEILSRDMMPAAEIATLGRGNLIDALYKRYARPKIVDPVFLLHHPKDVSPLARSNDDNPEIVDRFQLVVNGWELINAYSELADPIDQRQRFETQAAAARGGDDDALELDEDFLLALEHGMPPAAGWGMGLERVLALLTDSPNIKDTIMFPIHRKGE